MGVAFISNAYRINQKLLISTLQEVAMSTLFKLEKAKILPKSRIFDFLNLLKENFDDLIAPVRKGKYTVFSEVENVEDIVFEYTRTLLPPKKFILKYRRERFTYDAQTLEIEKKENLSKKQVIFGVHPCDLHGLTILDQIHLGEFPDPRYLEVRRNTVLIGLSCEPDEWCYCISTGTAFPDGANWDLFLTDIGDKYFVSIGSDKGDELVHLSDGLFEEVTEEDLNKFKEETAKKKHLFDYERLPDLERISQVIELEYESEVWKQEAERCLSCGTCTNTCPTCFCYTSVDIPSLDGKKVQRVEFITSCQYPYYSRVAGGHEFLEDRTARFRHRYYHKFVGYPYQIGKFGCVGCGRCSAFCPANISMVKTLKKLREGKKEKTNV
jgi:sulfhydrogenase subunit beta (sulfur reductase)